LFNWSSKEVRPEFNCGALRFPKRPGKSGGGPEYRFKTRTPGGSILSCPRVTKNEKGESPMKKQAFAVAVALLVSIIATGRCYAQRRVLVVNIPFAFQAGDTTMPAGEYRIEPVPTGTGYLHKVQQISGDALTMVSTIIVDAKDRKSEPQLIFNQYGKSYVLFQIWDGEGRGRQLFKSEREKELTRTETKVEVAVLVNSPSTKP
jgi:hypothetical protein